MISFLTQLFETLLLATHFVGVDLAMVGPLGAILLMRRGRRHHDPLATDAARWLIRLAVVALAVAIVLGLGLGVLMWATGEGRLLAGLRRLPSSRLYFSGLELGFYFVLVVPYALWWDGLNRWPVWRTVLLLAASTNLIYHFPGLFVTAAELAKTPQDPAISSAAFRAMMFTPAVLAQVVHHVLSAVAVGGVTLMVYATQREAVRRDDGAPPPVAVKGAQLALIASLLQIPVGLWLITTLAPSARNSVLGSDALTTGLFIAAMAAALGLLHHLSTAALGETDRRHSLLTLAMLALVILLMTGTLRQLRERPYLGAGSASRLAATQ